MFLKTFLYFTTTSFILCQKQSNAISYQTIEDSSFEGITDTKSVVLYPSGTVIGNWTTFGRVSLAFKGAVGLPSPNPIGLQYSCLLQTSFGSKPFASLSYIEKIFHNVTVGESYRLSFWHTLRSGFDLPISYNVIVGRDITYSTVPGGFSRSPNWEEVVLKVFEATSTNLTLRYQISSTDEKDRDIGISNVNLQRVISRFPGDFEPLAPRDKTEYTTFYIHAVLEIFSSTLTANDIRVPLLLDVALQKTVLASLDLPRNAFLFTLADVGEIVVIQVANSPTVSITYTIIILYNADINVLLSNLKISVSSGAFGKFFNSFIGLSSGSFSVTGSSFASADALSSLVRASNFDGRTNIVGAIVGGCVAGVFVILVILFIACYRKPILASSESVVPTMAVIELGMTPEEYEESQMPTAIAVTVAHELQTGVQEQCIEQHELPTTSAPAPATSFPVEFDDDSGRKSDFLK
jgi:hypothetical protein